MLLLLHKLSNMTDIDEIIEVLKQFRNERDWEQFHNPKDLAIALSIESNELLELFLWKDAQEVTGEKVKGELADVFSFAFLLTEKYGLNVKNILLEKIAENRIKYPVDKSKGNAKKYTDL